MSVCVDMYVCVCMCITFYLDFSWLLFLCWTRRRLALIATKVPSISCSRCYCTLPRPFASSPAHWTDFDCHCMLLLVLFLLILAYTLYSRSTASSSCSLWRFGSLFIQVSFLMLINKFCYTILHGLVLYNSSWISEEMGALETLLATQTFNCSPTKFVAFITSISII